MKTVGKLNYIFAYIGKHEIVHLEEKKLHEIARNAINWINKSCLNWINAKWLSDFRLGYNFIYGCKEN